MSDHFQRTWEGLKRYQQNLKLRDQSSLSPVTSQSTLEISEGGTIKRCDNQESVPRNTGTLLGAKVPSRAFQSPMLSKLKGIQTGTRISEKATNHTQKLNPCHTENTEETVTSECSANLANLNKQQPKLETPDLVSKTKCGSKDGNAEMVSSDRLKRVLEYKRKLASEIGHPEPNAEIFHLSEETQDLKISPSLHLSSCKNSDNRNMHEETEFSRVDEPSKSQSQFQLNVSISSVSGRKRNWVSPGFLNQKPGMDFRSRKPEQNSENVYLNSTKPIVKAKSSSVENAKNLLETTSNINLNLGDVNSPLKACSGRKKFEMTFPYNEESFYEHKNVSEFEEQENFLKFLKAGLNATTKLDVKTLHEQYFISLEETASKDLVQMPDEKFKKANSHFERAFLHESYLDFDETSLEDPLNKTDLIDRELKLDVKWPELNLGSVPKEPKITLSITEKDGESFLDYEFSSPCLTEIEDPGKFSIPIKPVVCSVDWVSLFSMKQDCPNFLPVEDENQKNHKARKLFDQFVMNSPDNFELEFDENQIAISAPPFSKQKFAVNEECCVTNFLQPSKSEKPLFSLITETKSEALASISCYMSQFTGSEELNSSSEHLPDFSGNETIELYEYRKRKICRSKLDQKSKKARKITLQEVCHSKSKTFSNLSHENPKVAKSAQTENDLETSHLISISENLNRFETRFETQHQKNQIGYFNESFELSDQSHSSRLNSNFFNLTPVKSDVQVTPNYNIRSILTLPNNDDTFDDREVSFGSSRFNKKFFDVSNNSTDLDFAENCGDVIEEDRLQKEAEYRSIERTAIHSPYFDAKLSGSDRNERSLGIKSASYIDESHSSDEFGSDEKSFTPTNQRNSERSLIKYQQAQASCFLPIEENSQPYLNNTPIVRRGKVSRIKNPEIIDHNQNYITGKDLGSCSQKNRTVSKLEEDFRVKKLNRPKDKLQQILAMSEELAQKFSSRSRNHKNKEIVSKNYLSSQNQQDYELSFSLSSAKDRKRLGISLSRITSRSVKINQMDKNGDNKNGYPITHSTPISKQNKIYRSKVDLIGQDKNTKLPDDSDISLEQPKAQDKRKFRLNCRTSSKTIIEKRVRFND